MRLLLAALCGLTLGHAQANFPFETEADRVPKTKTGGSVLFRGVQVITSAKQGTIPKTDVLIERGKITRIGPSLTAPAGTVVINGEGKTLTAGIIDGHSHRASDGTNEGTDSITCETRIGDVLNLGAFNVWQAVASGHTAACVLHGSANTVGGESIVIKYKYQRPNKEALIPGVPRMVKFALGENVTRKGDTGNRFPRSRMGVEVLLRRAFQEAREYRKNPPARKDLRLETLADILDRKVWVQCHSYRSDEMLMLVRLSQEFGFKIGAMQHALEGYKIAPELADAKVGISIFIDNWSFKVEAYDAIPWNAAISHNRGVNVSINTDGLSGTSALNVDAAKVMRYGGISPDEAMKMLTINPAMQLGLDSRTGSIEVGKDADLVLWDGHPLSPYSRCRMTLIDGEVFFERRDAFGIDATGTIKNDLREIGTRANAPLPKASNRYAIRDAMLYPVSQKPFRGSMLIENGRIKAIGSKIEIPSGTSIISGRGLQVYPGFIDAFTGLGLSEISSVDTMVDNFELGGNQPELDTATALWPESAHYAPARLNGVTNAFTGPQSAGVSGQGAIIHLAGKTPEEMTLSRRHGLVVNFTGNVPPVEFDVCHDECDASILLGLGGEHGQGTEHLTPTQISEFYDLMGGMVQEAPQADRESAAASSLEAYFDAALKYYKDGGSYNLAYEAMRPYLTGQKRVLISARNAPSIRAAVAFIQKYKLNGALRGASAAWREAPLLRRSGIPLILNPAGRTTLSANNTDAAWDPYDTPYVTPALLEKAGVKFCFASNSTADVMNLPIRVGQHCAYGLSPEAALKSITLDSAEILGVDKDLGSLEVGKLGNFFISDGDPFELTTAIRYVFIKGQPIPMESKHTMLREKYQTR